jgi:peptide deformylase
MSVKATAQIGSKVIRTRTRAVLKVDSRETKQIIKDLIDSMRHHNLVGMAAPQIGKGLRIFVTEIRKTTYRKNISTEDAVRVFINPRILEKSKRQVIGYEGCGSVASALLFGPVKRPCTVTVSAQDAEGRCFQLKATGLLARVIQHENDHLNGIVFLDRMTDTRKLLGREEYVGLPKKRN